MKRLSEFVKERRKEVNLTQEEFAERAGVTLAVVRKVEQGKVNLNMEKVVSELNSYSDNTLLDKVFYFELTLFSFLTGNNDMHLKNFR